MTLTPRQDGFVDAAVTWTFPTQPDSTSYLIRFFLNGEPSGVWYNLPQSGTGTITFDMRCLFPPNQQVTAVIEVPGGCTASTTQSAGFVPRPTAGSLSAEIDADGYLHASMPFTFPYQAGGDYSTRYAVSWITGPDGITREETNHYSLPAEGTLEFTRNAICWPRGSYQLHVQLRGCEWIDQVAAFDVEPEATGHIAVTDVGATGKHAAIDYQFEGTPNNSNNYRSIIVRVYDSAGTKRVEQTHFASMRNGTLGIDFDTSCWPEGNVRVVADLQQCSMPTRQIEGATKIQRTVDVSLSSLPASPTGELQALINYHFGQPTGHVTTKLLEWIDADGITHSPAQVLDDRDLSDGSGTFTVTFTLPSGAQQAHVMVSAAGCMWLLMTPGSNALHAITQRRGIPSITRTAICA